MVSFGRFWKRDLGEPGPASSAGTWRVGAGIACLCVAGAGAGFLLTPEAPARAAAPVEIRVAGHRVDPEADPKKEALRLARQHLATPLALDLGAAAGPVDRSRGSWGVRVDLERLEATLEAASDPRSPLRRHYARTGRDVLKLPMPAELPSAEAIDELIALKDRVDRKPVAARMDTDRKVPKPGHDGRTLDVWGTFDVLATAARGAAREQTARIRVEPATRSVASLEGAEMRAVLGTFETHYDTREKAADRTLNLKVAARKLDGLVLQPGETFDFNELVGDRSEANGFRPATVIAGGELVDGVGGGACQVAGTLHAAAFFAGLPMVERHPHSRPSYYIKLGLDAAVSYPKLNFRFKNNRSFPVVIEMKVEGGITHASVWGREQDRLVTFVRRIDEAVAFEEKTTDDEDLPKDVRVITQRGVPGFELTRWRIVRDLDKNQAVREKWEDIYPPTPRHVRVGVGAPPPEGYEPPGSDGHPEYVADEYMTMTQGPGVDGTLERKRQGTTGFYGWTEAAGLTPEAQASGE